jgi:hypothetical protein
VARVGDRLDRQRLVEQELFVGGEAWHHRLDALPTTLFLAVYLGCTAAAARILPGRPRIAAVLACLAVAVVLAFCGPSLLAAVRSSVTLSLR